MEEDLAAMEKRIHMLRRKAEYYNALVLAQRADDCNPMSGVRMKEQPAATA